MQRMWSEVRYSEGTGQTYWESRKVSCPEYKLTSWYKYQKWFLSRLDIVACDPEHVDCLDNFLFTDVRGEILNQGSPFGVMNVRLASLWKEIWRNTYKKDFVFVTKRYYITVHFRGFAQWSSVSNTCIWDWSLPYLV